MTTPTSPQLERGVDADALDDRALDVLFRAARTANNFSDEPVDESTLRDLYELVKWAPTSANTSPLRIVYVTSDEGKERLLPHVYEMNQAKVASAPVSAILAVDGSFHDRIPELFPFRPEMRDRFVDESVREPIGRFNAAIQIGYFILAARAVGLTAGPLAGFDSAGVDAEFLGGTDWRSLLIVNLGHPGENPWFDRLPRLSYEDAVREV